VSIASRLAKAIARRVRTSAQPRPPRLEPASPSPAAVPPPRRAATAAPLQSAPQSREVEAPPPGLPAQNAEAAAPVPSSRWRGPCLARDAETGLQCRLLDGHQLAGDTIDDAHLAACTPRERAELLELRPHRLAQLRAHRSERGHFTRCMNPGDIADLTERA